MLTIEQAQTTVYTLSEMLNERIEKLKVNASTRKLTWYIYDMRPSYRKALQYLQEHFTAEDYAAQKSPDHQEGTISIFVPVGFKLPKVELPRERAEKSLKALPQLEAELCRLEEEKSRLQDLIRLRQSLQVGSLRKEDGWNLEESGDKFEFTRKFPSPKQAQEAIEKLKVRYFEVLKGEFVNSIWNPGSVYSVANEYGNTAFDISIRKDNSEVIVSFDNFWRTQIRRRS